jgi:hypothetical protein
VGASVIFDVEVRDMTRYQEFMRLIRTSRFRSSRVSHVNHS